MRTIGSSVIGLAVIISLAACSGDPNAAADPASPPTATISSVPPTTPEPSATPSSPTPPQGPKQFVRAWVEALNSATSTGRIGDLQALASDRCDTCAQMTGLIRRTYANGGFIKTRGWTVTSQTLVDPGALNLTPVDILVRTAPESFQPRGAPVTNRSPMR